MAHATFVMSITIDIAKGIEELFMLRTTRPSFAKGEIQRRKVSAHDRVPTASRPSKVIKYVETVMKAVRIRLPRSG